MAPSINQSEVEETVTDEDAALPPGMPLKNEAASPRQMGQVRLDWKQKLKD